MTDFSTHRPCEVMALNGVDLALAKNYLYTLDYFENYGPLTHFIMFSNIKSTHDFPGIENSVIDVNEYIEYQIDLKIYNKKTGVEVKIVDNGLKFNAIELKRYANGERDFSGIYTPIPGGN